METPKVFISYSWHPAGNQLWVIKLAERLMSDGIEVVLDVWDLKDGHDKNVFMERMVNDSSIAKVLVICNKDYSEKANRRTGGELVSRVQSYLQMSIIKLTRISLSRLFVKRMIREMLILQLT